VINIPAIRTRRDGSKYPLATVRKSKRSIPDKFAGKVFDLNVLHKEYIKYLQIDIDGLHRNVAKHLESIERNENNIHKLQEEIGRVDREGVFSEDFFRLKNGALERWITKKIRDAQESAEAEGETETDEGIILGGPYTDIRNELIKLRDKLATTTAVNTLMEYITETEEHIVLIGRV
jgi:hypothetical protein